MACCLMAPSHYLNQCWLIISKVLLLSCEGNCTRDASSINHYNLFENYMSKISFKFPRGQWVNSLKSTQHGITVTSTCTWSNDDLDLWQQMVSLGNRELHHRLNTNLCTNCANNNYNSLPGPWFNIKITSYQCRKSHCGDKTVIRSSYLHNGISHTGKMSSLYWIRAQYVIHSHFQQTIQFCCTHCTERYFSIDCHTELFIIMKDAFIFHIISWIFLNRIRQDLQRSTPTGCFYIVNTMPADAMVTQHIEAEAKWTTFSNAFSSIGSNNGLTLTRRQAIIWTNDGWVYWRTYASLGLNELRKPGHQHMALILKGKVDICWCPGASSTNMV